MKTLFVLAASALALATASSAFAETTVKVRGRTDAAIHADIVAAASSICREDVGSHANDLYTYCVREVTRDAVVRIGSPTLKAYDRQAFRANGVLKISY